MTEKEWMECEDPETVLDFLRDKASERKYRLFACACCRLIWPQMTSVRGRRAVETVEKYVDGLVDRKAMIAAGRAASAARKFKERTWPHALTAARDTALSFGPVEVAINVVNDVVATGEASGTSVVICKVWRHIIGSPFRTYPVLETWPATVTQLANALYNGEDCGFALHDALLEAGHPELAEHFRQEQSHPKGCWVVDLVLGKK